MPKGGVHHLHATAASPTQTLIDIALGDPNVWFNSTFFKYATEAPDESYIRVSDYNDTVERRENMTKTLTETINLKSETV